MNVSDLGLIRTLSIKVWQILGKSPDLVTLAQHAGVGTVGSAERVVDVHVAQLGQAFTELLDL